MKKNLLWIDGTGGLAAGILVLSIHPWLSDFYGLPQSFILFTGIVNLAYGSYSTPLAIRKKRTKRQISILAMANIIWGLLCFVFWGWFFESITIFGILHLTLEGIYVASLGYFEWKWLPDILTKEP